MLAKNCLDRFHRHIPIRSYIFRIKSNCVITFVKFLSYPTVCVVTSVLALPACVT